MASSDPFPALSHQAPTRIVAVLPAMLEDAAFRSGWALAGISACLQKDGVPFALWRERLALFAAEATLALSGQPVRAADLRDSLHLARPQDNPGPAGEVYRSWRRAVALPLTYPALARALPQIAGADLTRLWQTTSAPPVVQAATLLEVALQMCPTDEVAALILADAVLARAMGWAHLLPLLAVGLSFRDLRKSGDALRLACHQALAVVAPKAEAEAQDLARRATKLLAVAPQLRAKPVAAAIGLFLSCDAVSASQDLAGLMTDRAARRLCQRLAVLGVVRELTGRDTFRLYGL